ncbi:MAG: hypothetical protein QOH92_1984 [Chloroflexota bacterium]|jgi:hypothetical protein|nr:hypothetical protein [Chloroflexota bacterium]
MNQQRFQLDRRGSESYPAFWSDHPPVIRANSYEVDPKSTYPLSEINKGKIGDCKVERDQSGNDWVLPLFQVTAEDPEFYAFWDVDEDGTASLSTVLMTTRESRR